MVAIVLGVSLLQAFMLEIGFMLFFLPYTMAFNWVWDTLRERVIRHRRPRQTGAVNPGADLRRSAVTLSPKLSQQTNHKYGKLHSFFWFDGS